MLYTVHDIVYMRGGGEEGRSGGRRQGGGGQEPWSKRGGEVSRGEERAGSGILEVAAEPGEIGFFFVTLNNIFQ